MAMYLFFFLSWGQLIQHKAAYTMMSHLMKQADTLKLGLDLKSKVEDIDMFKATCIQSNGFPKLVTYVRVPELFILSVMFPYS